MTIPPPLYSAKKLLPCLAFLSSSTGQSRLLTLGPQPRPRSTGRRSCLAVPFSGIGWTAIRLEGLVDRGQLDRCPLFRSAAGIPGELFSPQLCSEKEEGSLMEKGDTSEGEDRTCGRHADLAIYSAYWGKLPARQLTL